MQLQTVFEQPLCEIWQGDCREVMRHNAIAWQGAFDFIFADPPFNIGHGYDVYRDNKSENDFRDFMLEWIGYCVFCLRDGGVIVIHVPDNLVHIPLIALRPENVDVTRIDWIIWHYRFGECQRHKFINSKAHGLVFRKGVDSIHTFNADSILVESDRASKYNDSRTIDSATPGKRLPFDVWSGENDGMYWGRVQGNNKERIANHPNQLPERYIERYIKAYTNQGEFCFDPFGGTGTTAVVARELGRNVVTCELSAAYCDDIANRVKKGAVNLQG